MGDRRTEHRHHGIANMLVDMAAEAGDHPVDSREKTRHHRVQILGVEAARQAGEPDQVREQDSDLAPLTGRLGAVGRARGRLDFFKLRPATAAKAGIVLVVGIAGRAGLGQRGAATAAETAAGTVLGIAVRAVHGTNSDRRRPSVVGMLGPIGHRPQWAQPAKRTAAIGGRWPDRVRQLSPAFSEIHSDPVVEPIAKVSPLSSTARPWR